MNFSKKHKKINQSKRLTKGICPYFWCVRSRDYLCCDPESCTDDCISCNQVTKYHCSLCGHLDEVHNCCDYGLPLSRVK